VTYLNPCRGCREVTKLQEEKLFLECGGRKLTLKDFQSRNLMSLDFPDYIKNPLFQRNESLVAFSDTDIIVLSTNHQKLKSSLCADLKTYLDQKNLFYSQTNQVCELR
jgi:hypothetical protein